MHLICYLGDSQTQVHSLDPVCGSLATGPQAADKCMKLHLWKRLLVHVKPSPLPPSVAAATTAGPGSQKSWGPLCYLIFLELTRKGFQRKCAAPVAEPHSCHSNEASGWWCPYCICIYTYIHTHTLCSIVSKSWKLWRRPSHFLGKVSHFLKRVIMVAGPLLRNVECDGSIV